jgi:hypothetical protein
MLKQEIGDYLTTYAGVTKRYKIISIYLQLINSITRMFVSEDENYTI